MFAQDDEADINYELCQREAENSHVCVKKNNEIHLQPFSVSYFDGRVSKVDQRQSSKKIKGRLRNCFEIHETWNWSLILITSPYVQTF